MQNLLAMDEEEAVEQLLHHFLDLPHRELDVDIGEEAGEVVLAEFEHQVEGGLVLGRGGLCPADLDQGYHILVFQQLQDLYLSQGGDRKAFLLVLHQHLLEGHYLSGLFVSRFEYFTESTCNWQTIR